MISGFNALPDQDAKIRALKQTTFELALIAMAQYYWPETETLHVEGLVLPVREFSCSDPKDEAFGREVINTLKSLRMFQLTTTETALLSAYVLLEQSPGAEQFVSQLKNCLSAQLHQRLSIDVDISLNKIIEFLPKLRSLAKAHYSCLARFVKQMAEVKMEVDGDEQPAYAQPQQQQQQPSAAADILQTFPPLYNELFASSITD